MAEMLGAQDVNVLYVGREYEALVKLPAWKLIQDWLQARVDVAMEANRDSMSTDPLVMHGLRQNWWLASSTLTDLQKHVLETIEVKRVLVQALLDSGMSPSQLAAELPDVKFGVSMGNGSNGLK